MLKLPTVVSHVIGVPALVSGTSRRALVCFHHWSPHSAHSPPKPRPRTAITMTMSGQIRRFTPSIVASRSSGHDGAVRPAAIARAAAVLATLALVALPGSAAAKPKPKRYHIALIEVTAAAGLPAESADAIPIARAEVVKELAEHPQLVALDGAPDPAVDGKKFKAWLVKKKIAGAYRMNVEITSYEEELEDKDASVNQEKRLVIRLGLRTFGETIPDRKMAFAADGSATIKVDVGKKLRPRDRTFAIESAAQGAVTDALAASLVKLALPPPPPAKRKK